MALYKELKTDQGIPVSYHRISNIEIITNKKVEIVVLSYINEEERKKEEAYNIAIKKYANEEELTEEEIFLIKNKTKIYFYIDRVMLEYVPSMSIDGAYEYLKTTERYKNAMNI